MDPALFCREQSKQDNEKKGLILVINAFYLQSLHLSGVVEPPIFGAAPAQELFQKHVCKKQSLQEK